ncbi:meiotic recombination protein SPO11-1 isoform X2 [Silene latifolia]|uniref:meiotic recombination protein SPO11-1 isoform X2 n=1 Tax=Silene latifolia TaxID=37657 RepID=UPI003D774897
MEGNRLNPKSSDLLHKIRGFVRSIVIELCNGRSPVISVNKFRTYCSNSVDNCLCSSGMPTGVETLTLRKQSHAHRTNVLLRVLLIVQQLLQENRHASKRDIYYTYPSIFSDQSVVDRAINDICILLECSRHNLNVVSVAKGYLHLHLFRFSPSVLLALFCLMMLSWLQAITKFLRLVMGWIRFTEDGKKCDCLSSPNTAQSIPVQVEDIQDILSFARYILVIEKESVFQRLANDRFCSFNQCIVITGRGYPDIPTRRFLRLLAEKLCIPVYGLVDSDPYGFDILTTYRFGSLEMAYDAELLRIPEICWIGAFTSDSERYDLPSQCLLPLSTEDKKRTEAILSRCYLQNELQWRLELEMMLEKGVKFEIEALSVHSLSYLSEKYLPSKIKEMD